MRDQDFVETAIIFFLLPIIVFGGIGGIFSLAILSLIIEIGLIVGIIYFMVWIFSGNKNHLFAGIFLVMSSFFINTAAMTIGKEVGLQEVIKYMIQTPFLNTVVGMFYGVSQIIGASLNFGILVWVVVGFVSLIIVLTRTRA